jgi:hypothetical protein
VDRIAVLFAHKLGYLPRSDTTFSDSLMRR